MSTNYVASAAVTITLASLASSSTLVTGRASTSISNTTNKYDFILPTLKFRSGTTPTAATYLEFWAFAQRADTTWPEIFTAAYSGADGGFTATSRDILYAGAVLLGAATVDATTGRDYVIRGRELAQAFGAMPQNVAFFVTHSTAVALDATGGNFVMTINPGTYS
jgi:hypothetical protein